MGALHTASLRERLTLAHQGVVRNMNRRARSRRKRQLVFLWDLIEVTSNRLRCSTPFIGAAPANWVSVVIMESLFGRVGLTQMMSA